MNLKWNDCDADSKLHLGATLRGANWIKTLFKIKYMYVFMLLIVFWGFFDKLFIVRPSRLSGTSCEFKRDVIGSILTRRNYLFSLIRQTVGLNLPLNTQCLENWAKCGEIIMLLHYILLV